MIKTEERERERKAEAIYEERLFKKFPNLTKDINSQFQEITDSSSSLINAIIITP